MDNINRPGVDTDIETSSSLKSLKYSLIDMLIIGFVCITTTAMLSVSLTILYFKYGRCMFSWFDKKEWNQHRRTTIFGYGPKYENLHLVLNTWFYYNQGFNKHDKGI